MVSLISMAEARAWQLNESMDQLYEPKKMDTHYEMLQKSQTHDMMNSAPLVASAARCSVSAFTPSSPNSLLLRSTAFMVLLTRNASARACRVGTRQRPSGQQTRGRFTAAVLNYLHCQLVVPHVKILTRAHSCQILTSPSNPLYSTCLHRDLLPPFFNNENTFRNRIPPPERG